MCHCPHANFDDLLVVITDVRIRVYRATNCKELFSEVRFAIGPPKPIQNGEQTRLSDGKVRRKLFFCVFLQSIYLDSGHVSFNDSTIHKQLELQSS